MYPSIALGDITFMIVEQNEFDIFLKTMQTDVIFPRLHRMIPALL